MHTRQLPAKAGNCGYAKPLYAMKKEKNPTFKNHRSQK
jgi:hypothetical protein